jgi:hypothetical protein
MTMKRRHAPPSIHHHPTVGRRSNATAGQRVEVNAAGAPISPADIEGPSDDGTGYCSRYPYKVTLLLALHAAARAKGGGRDQNCAVTSAPGPCERYGCHE